MIKKLIYIIIIVLILNGCSTTVRFSSENNVDSKTGKVTKTNSYNFNRDLGDNDNPIVLEAKNWLGTPYCYGGEDKNCTDCSGFVQSVFAEIGFDLPRTAQEQYNAGIAIKTKNAKPADLIFFGENDKITHVGIFIGEQYFIHAASSKGVSISSINESYYQNKFIGFKRYLN